MIKLVTEDEWFAITEKCQTFFSVFAYSVQLQVYCNAESMDVYHNHSHSKIDNFITFVIDFYNATFFEIHSIDVPYSHIQLKT